MTDEAICFGAAIFIIMTIFYLAKEDGKRLK